MDHYYHTLAEAVELLPSKPTVEWLVKQMTDPDMGEVNYMGIPPIPSFRTNDLLEVTIEGKIHILAGWFDIEGLEDNPSIINGNVCIDGVSKDPHLIRFDRYICYPSQPIKIPVNDLYIRDDELVHIIEHYTGEALSLRDEGTEQEENQSTNAVDFDPEAYIESCLLQEMTPDEIIVSLVDQFGTRREKFYGVIARKFDKNRHIGVDHTSWRQRGSRLYKKAKRRLTSKKVTHPPSSVTP